MDGLLAGAALLLRLLCAKEEIRTHLQLGKLSSDFYLWVFGTSGDTELMAFVKEYQTKAQRSGSGLERRSSGVSTP